MTMGDVERIDRQYIVTISTLPGDENDFEPVELRDTLSLELDVGIEDHVSVERAPTRALCPHCHEPLHDVEEIFKEWAVWWAGDGWVLGGPEPFEAGSCVACGGFVDASGREAPPPEIAGSRNVISKLASDEAVPERLQGESEADYSGRVARMRAQRAELGRNASDVSAEPPLAKFKRVWE